ncbi:hypothetical protein [Acanthopleuribacter pedis]|uniref:Uncharacterized protein n=1 Tax=Acanthopleuribacter pedis TaxID=442870 RepID=A0A8J7Q6Z1_9BACT|nr:hypothetical protein [Acanthopleuribacter pedis]MBO1321712.1 hypothetical protein [Acanthopleuribacter pedis]
MDQTFIDQEDSPGDTKALLVLHDLGKFRPDFQRFLRGEIGEEPMETLPNKIFLVTDAKTLNADAKITINDLSDSTKHYLIQAAGRSYRPQRASSHRFLTHHWNSCCLLALGEYAYDDLCELHEHWVIALGARRALWKFICAVIRSLPHMAIDRLTQRWFRHKRL